MSFRLKPNDRQPEKCDPSEITQDPLLPQALSGVNTGQHNQTQIQTRTQGYTK